MLSLIAPGLWDVIAPLTVAGMQLGHRMTVAQLPNGRLWLHSPVAFSENLAKALAPLGPVEHIVAPNCMHDTYLEGWFAAHPTARFHAAPGLAKMRPDLPFTDTLSDQGPAEWAPVFNQHVLRGMPRINESVFLHRDSGTLIVTDLAFNLGPEMPFLSRVLLRLNDCYCRFGPSRLLKSTIKDRAALRSSLDTILAWDFDRIVLSHGENILQQGKTRLRDAFAFL
jgi:hypothetical protein